MCCACATSVLAERRQEPVPSRAVRTKPPSLSRARSAPAGPNPAVARKPCSDRRAAPAQRRRRPARAPRPRVARRGSRQAPAQMAVRPLLSRLAVASGLSSRGPATAQTQRKPPGPEPMREKLLQSLRRHPLRDGQQRHGRIRRAPCDRFPRLPWQALPAGPSGRPCPRRSIRSAGPSGSRRSARHLCRMSGCRWPMASRRKPRRSARRRGAPACC